MALVVSAMDLAERPRNQRPTDPPTTTPKPETTTEDTSNRILSLPIEEKCAKSNYFLHLHDEFLHSIEREIAILLLRVFLLLVTLTIFEQNITKVILLQNIVHL